MGNDTAGSDDRNVGTTPDAPDVATAIGDNAPQSLRLVDVVLLSDDTRTAVVDGMVLVIDAQGVTMTYPGERRRTVLPWSLLSTPEVDPWHGEDLPPWWIDPELRRNNDDGPETPVTEPRATFRPTPNQVTEAMITLRTPDTSYRLLVPDGDADQLVSMMAGFSLGDSTTPLSATSSVDGNPVRANDSASQSGRSSTGTADATWKRIQPFVVVLMVLILVTMVTLILLQSAGTIDIPILGGASSSGLAPLGAS